MISIKKTESIYGHKDSLGEETESINGHKDSLGEETESINGHKDSLGEETESINGHKNSLGEETGNRRDGQDKTKQRGSFKVSRKKTRATKGLKRNSIYVKPGKCKSLFIIKGEVSNKTPVIEGNPITTINKKLVKYLGKK